MSSSWAAVGDSASGEGDEKNPTQAARGGEESGETAMACRKAVAGISQVARRTGGSSPVEEIKLKEQKGPAWTEIVWDEVGAKREKVLLYIITRTEWYSSSNTLSTYNSKESVSPESRMTDVCWLLILFTRYVWSHLLN